MMLGVAWAVEPANQRARILNEGLLPRLDHGENELYLFDTLKRAERFAADTLEFYLDGPEGRIDIWEAQVAGLPVSLLDDEEGHTAFVKGAVPPEGLRLVHTIT